MHTLLVEGICAYLCICHLSLTSALWYFDLDTVVVVIAWQLDLITSYAISAITTNIVSSIPTQAIQQYVIKFVSHLWQIGGFLHQSN